MNFEPYKNFAFCCVVSYVPVTLEILKFSHGICIVILSYHCITFMCRNYQRDGPMTVTNNQGGAPNYFPNSFSGPQPNRSGEHVIAL